MSTIKAGAAVCEALLSQESILDASERNLINSLIARARSSGRPGETYLPESIARLAGEIVAERVSGSLGKDIERWLLLPGRSAGEHRGEAIEMAARMGPVSPPSPTPGNAPHPPGPNPPGGIAALLNRDSTGSVARGLPEIQPAPCVIFEEFLTPAELHNLMQEVLEREMQFQISEVISPGASGGAVDFEYRRSRVLLDLGRHHSIILDRIQSCSPRVFEKLGVEPFWPTRAEVQITASNHGDFFRCHSDNGHPDIRSRALTFVYFFHREPKKFHGGELRLYDSRMQDGASVPAETHRVIVPRQNQIVFFPSSLEHEITTVDCSSQEFADSRFTVNGWLHH
jgi:hypothetical protein